MTQHQPAPPEANAPAKAILLVEDNPDDVMLTLRAFQKNNLHGLVQVVRDGAEALDYLFATGAFAGRDTAHQPRLILLDLNLPKLNGLEVLDRIRADRRTRFLPVIAFTRICRVCRDLAANLALLVRHQLRSSGACGRFGDAHGSSELKARSSSKAPRTKLKPRPSAAHFERCPFEFSLSFELSPLNFPLRHPSR
jgi:CheY-like chemotaxis protein